MCKWRHADHRIENRPMGVCIFLKPDHADCWVAGDHRGIAPTGSGHAMFSHPIHLKNPAVSWFKTKNRRHADHRVENRTTRIVGWRTGRKMFRPYGIGLCGVFFFYPIPCLNLDKARF